MNTRSQRRPSVISSALENLEGRVVLSAMATAAVLPTGTMEVAARSSKSPTTVINLAVHAGTLAQPIAVAVTVKAPASAGSPRGSVNLMDHGQLIATIPLSPTASPKGAKFAMSVGSVNLNSTPGGGSYYFGSHEVVAKFVPAGRFAASKANGSIVVNQPIYSTLAGGTQTATVVQGSGPQIQPGQTARVLYTGYLASSGQIFDNSLSHGGTPLSFKVGAGNVIPGFDSGTLGMQVGESRLIQIPPEQGYGATPTGSIPANSTLLFVVTLQSIG